MLHAAHAAVSWPAHLVVVSNDILIVGIWVLSQEPLDEIPRILLTEAEDHDETIHVTAVQANRMPELRVHVLEGEEFVGQLRWSCNFRGSRKTKHEEIQDKAVILEDERAKLQTLDETVRVCMVHVFVVDHNVVLGSHVVCNVVIHDQAQQTVEKSQVNLLGDVLELALQHNYTLSIGCVPDICQVIHTLAPLVDQQWCGLGVGWLDPIGEQVAMVTLIPQILVKVCISDFLQGLNLIARRQV
mmetsp:Transcript_45139/g.81182  ORF Transcript_45139/g.81182 Transcript_45139/m.81182 type:complete len:243 (+) Transcript_45139:3641-4369(+)